MGLPEPEAWARLRAAAGRAPALELRRRTFLFGGAQHLGHRRGYAAEPRVRAMGMTQQLSGRRRDGSLFPVEVALSPTNDRAARRLTIATVRDVSERVEAAEELAESKRARAVLADRERMARDLHDTVIQELFATGMHLQATLPLLDESGAARVSDAVDNIDEIIKHVRDTIFGLTSGDTDELRSRLEDLVHSYDERFTSPTTLTLSGDVNEVSRHVIEQLVPTLREAMSNAAQHAGAGEVRVVVSKVADRLQLEVRDNGCGLPEDRTGRGHGLANMRERAEGLGGELLLSDNSGVGTAVIWSVPLAD